jgi:hypothetical protein
MWIRVLVPHSSGTAQQTEHVITAHRSTANRTCNHSEIKNCSDALRMHGGINIADEALSLEQNRTSSLHTVRLYGKHTWNTYTHGKLP